MLDVIEKLSTLIGRAFLVSAFLPSVVFFGLSITVGILFYGPDNPAKEWADLADDLKIGLGLGFAALTFILAYLVFHTKVLLISLAEGRYLPWPLRGWKIKREARRRHRMDEARLESRKRLLELTRERSRFLDRLRARPDSGKHYITHLLARIIPARSRSMTPSRTPSECRDLYETAIRKLTELDEISASGGRIPCDELVALGDSLLKLKEECSENLLDELPRRLSDHWEYALLQAQVAFDQALEDLAVSFPRRPYFAPTRLGNVLQAAWDYPIRRYKIDGLGLWPHIQNSMEKDFRLRLEDAKAAMDFMITMCCGSFAFAIGWSIAIGVSLGFTGGWDRWYFMATLAGIPAGLIFYAAAVRSASGFTSLVRTAFDLYRWNLADAFQVERPKNIKEERNVWDNISQLVVVGDPAAILTYRAEAPPSKGDEEANKVKGGDEKE